jgi:chemotaxis protein methyltransferase CheR
MGSNAAILGLPNQANTLLRDLIHERTGLYFDNGRAELLTDKLSPLVIQRGFTSFLDYYYLLKYDNTAEDEWREVINSLSVPETYFWREMDQIRTLVDMIIPRWFADGRTEPFRIWSAACASGEEPLTIAMALEEAGWWDRFPIEIYASDASSRAISKAQAGIYGERSFRSLAPSLRAKYFVQETEKPLWRVNERLHSRINWSVANLVNDSSVARLAAVNAIFCRNVFIYFSDLSIGKTVRLFADHLRSPGYLFVATSESLLRLTTAFDLQEIGDAFVYVRSSLPG